MDLQRLPFLPIQYFYFQFTKGHKAFFMLGLLLVILASTFLGFAYLNPTYWSLETFELQSSVLEEASIENIEVNYREFDVSMPVFWQKILHAAGPILPKAFPFFVFAAFQVLGWTLALTVITQIKSRWIYLFYLLFALFIHFSGIHLLWFEGENILGRLLEFGILISYLGIASLFQMNVLKWGTWARFAVFIGLSAIWFGYPLSQGQLLDAHGIMQGTFFFNLFLLVPYFLFTGKDSINLIILVATNRPQKEGRWPYWLIVVAVFLFLIVEFLWLNEFMNWNLFGLDISLSFKPTHLLMLMGILTIFTSQNQYHQIRSIFSNQFVYVILLASWSIIVLSYISSCMASGDIVFPFTLDRMVAIFYAGVSLFFAFFVFMNHGRLLRRRINLYYLITQSREFNFFVIWLLSLGIIVILEGSEFWKSFTLFSHTYTLNIGDEAWYNGERTQAETAYNLAARSVISSTKAHYNLGALAMLKPNNQDIAAHHYLDAVVRFDFPYAWLNAAQLLNELRRPDRSREVLRQAHARMPASPLVANNFAVNYWNANQPDSAISLMKQGLLANPTHAPLYSNLGLLYHLYEKEKDSKAFIQASVDAPNPSPAVWTNYLVQNILSTDSSATLLPEYKSELGKDFWLTYHHFILLDPTSTDTTGQQLLDRVANETAYPEAILLDGWRMIQADSMEKGESRLTYLANTQKGFAGRANYLLGLTYYQKGFISKARHYFLQQGDIDPTGKLFAAKMNLDRGFFDAAYEELTALRGESEDMFESTSRELAMLLKSNGFLTYAMSEWDLDNLSLNERIRVGIYSDSLSKFSLALDNFRQVIEYDSSTVAPYLELGKIYNKYRDPFALENLMFGLEKDPDNISIKREIARAHIYKKQFQEAFTYIDSSSTMPADQVLLAEWFLESGDTTSAILCLQKLVEQQPLYEPAILYLSNIFEKRKEYAAGYDLMANTLIKNDLNPLYWYAYATFAKNYEEEDEALEAAIRAVSLLPKSDLKTKIIRDFRIPQNQIP